MKGPSTFSLACLQIGDLGPGALGFLGHPPKNESGNPKPPINYTLEDERLGN